MREGIFSQRQTLTNLLIWKPLIRVLSNRPNKMSIKATDIKMKDSPLMLSLSLAPPTSDNF